MYNTKWASLEKLKSLLKAFKDSFSLEENKMDLKGFNFRGSNLDQQNLKASLIDESNLSDCSLRGADFSYASLRGCNLRFANLENTNLTGADLRGADLEFTKNWKTATFKKAKVDELTILPFDESLIDSFEIKKVGS